jgi:hypothetical protein
MRVFKCGGVAVSIMSSADHAQLLQWGAGDQLVVSWPGHDLLQERPNHCRGQLTDTTEAPGCGQIRPLNDANKQLLLRSNDLL